LEASVGDDRVEALARALEELAANLKPLQPQGAGFNISVTGGAAGSHTTGVRQTLTATGDGQTLIGMQASFSDAKVIDQHEHLVAELKEAAQAVRANNAPRGWIEPLVARVAALGNKAIESGLVAVANGAVAQLFG
jgi:hypothetical protein